MAFDGSKFRGLDGLGIILASEGVPIDTNKPLDTFLERTLINNHMALDAQGHTVTWSPKVAAVTSARFYQADGYKRARPYCSIVPSTILYLPWIVQPGLEKIDITMIGNVLNQLGEGEVTFSIEVLGFTNTEIVNIEGKPFELGDNFSNNVVTEFSTAMRNHHVSQELTTAPNVEFVTRLKLTQHSTANYFDDADDVAIRVENRVFKNSNNNNQLFLFDETILFNARGSGDPDPEAPELYAFATSFGGFDRGTDILWGTYYPTGTPTETGPDPPTGTLPLNMLFVNNIIGNEIAVFQSEAINFNPTDWILGEPDRSRRLSLSAFHMRSLMIKETFNSLQTRDQDTLPREIVEANTSIRHIIEQNKLVNRWRPLWIGPNAEVSDPEAPVDVSGYNRRFERVYGSTVKQVWFQADIYPRKKDPTIRALVHYIPCWKDNNLERSTVNLDDIFNNSAFATWDIQMNIRSLGESQVASPYISATQDTLENIFFNDQLQMFPLNSGATCPFLFNEWMLNYQYKANHVRIFPTSLPIEVPPKEGSLFTLDESLVQLLDISIQVQWNPLLTENTDTQNAPLRINFSASTTLSGVGVPTGGKFPGVEDFYLVCVGATIWEQ